MKIRSKLVYVVLPLLIVPLILVGVSSTFSARNGITQIATTFLRFKAEEIEKYAASQWNLLVENDLSDESTFVDATKTVVESFAVSMIRSDTELIVAFDAEGTISLQTGNVDISPGELDAVLEISRSDPEGWHQVELGGVLRVVQTVVFEPFEWLILVTEQRNAFYSSVDRIIWQAGIILVASIVATMILLLIFISYITKPLRTVLDAMRNIISTNDLSRKVTIQFRDEIGELGHTFNLMTGELEKAYNQVKGYALRAVVAQKKEQKIRNIFQKYVPKDVIERFFANPGSMLEGENRVLALLFSDIRDFTTISEHMESKDIVESLNKYFGLMVDIIVKRDGIVDKYIGDAIMAFYGAPVTHDNDAKQAVMSAIEMSKALDSFNKWQAERDRPAFRTGIGINFGEVTVGNIGSQKKMDYTVIGDMVNLASRLEALTKKYKVPILVSDSVEEQINGSISCRMVDKVAVKGRKTGSPIYTVSNSLSSKEREVWEMHSKALQCFYARDFHAAGVLFATMLRMLPDDPIARIFILRCREYETNPPPESWQGVMTMTEK